MNRIAWLLLAGGVAAGFTLGAWWRSSPPAGTTLSAANTPARTVLYYRNPMGLPDTSPVPKKSPDGMDYVPVYADEQATEPGVVALGPDKVQKLGVRTAVVRRGVLARTIRASGTIMVDETRRHTIAPKFEGWIEKLVVNQTGAPVRRGQRLAEFYSPELVSAQQEYIIANQALAALGHAGSDAGTSMEALADAALRRLRNWDIPEAELAALHRGEVRRTLALASPVNGVVLEKRAIEGMRFMPGEMLFDLADLSQVWLIAEVSALDLADVRAGQSVRFTTPALPGQEFRGAVSFVYPTLTDATRTVKARAVLPNPQGTLRPSLFGPVEITVADAEPRLIVPASAVLDSGLRQTVLVAREGGRFEPREVKLGRRGDQIVEVLDGVAEGENVVVSANFLIDAESNLKSALEGLGTHGGHGGAAPASQPDAEKTSSVPAAQSGHGGN